MKSDTAFIFFLFCFPLVLTTILFPLNAISEEGYQDILNLTSDLNIVPLCTDADHLLKERLAEKMETFTNTEMGKRATQWARQLLQEEKTIPLTTYTLYREFQRTGDRKKYEEPCFLKRSMLTATALLILFEKDDSLLPLLHDLIWSICEETNWVVPAHERQEKYTYVDLFSAETATQLAHILLFLKDKLPEEIQNRIRYEVKKRVMQPYLFYSEEKYGWVRGNNNWTGVCAGSIGECFIILETNEQILRRALQLVITQLSRFLQNGFAEDGGCLEGISYWNYGLTHYVSFAELLYEATNSKINILSNPRIQQIAYYPYVVYLGHGKFASFSDAPSQFYPHAFITHRIAERLSASERLSSTAHPFIHPKLGQRLNIEYLHSLANPEPTHWHFGNVIRNVLWSYPYNQQTLTEVPIESVYLPKSGIAKLVNKNANRNTYILICKAGSNNEPHNHNDVGSFIFAVDDTIFLTDPGAGLYSREYFSAKRYENIFTNSYGHSLPVIAGKLQSTGAKFTGEMKYEEDTVHIDFTNAYDLTTLKKAERTFNLRNNELIMTDKFEFSNQGGPVEEALITWLPVKTEKNKAIIQGKNTNLIITTSYGQFKTESLKEQCIKNNRSGELTRITVDLPAQKETTITFNMTSNNS